ncbi:MAG: histidine phosphatase family protein [Rhodospirillales bacterium]
MIIYFRHAASDKTQKDERPVDLSDCAKQRNLSDEGRRQSQAIGEAIRALGIPVGPVISSPFCRTIDTAKLAFGKVEKSDVLQFTIGASPGEKSQAEAALRKMLSDKPPAGQNRVIVSHTANLKDATGIWPKPEGVAIVFEPRGAGGFQAVARIAPDAWSQVVAQAKKQN